MLQPTAMDSVFLSLPAHPSAEGHCHAEACTLCRQQWQGDGMLAKFKTKTNIPSFQSSFPGRLLHWHFTSPSATTTLPDGIQEDSEHKRTLCMSHPLVKASFVLSSKKPTTNSTTLGCPSVEESFYIACSKNTGSSKTWEKDQDRPRVNQSQRWLI